MAPEIMDSEEFGLDRAVLSPQTDVYSLGMTIWEMFAGCPPFNVLPRDPVVIRRVLQGVRPERSQGADLLGLSDEVWELIEQCWCTEWSKRPSMESIMQCVAEHAESRSRTSAISSDQRSRRHQPRPPVFSSLREKLEWPSAKRALSGDSTRTECTTSDPALPSHVACRRVVKQWIRGEIIARRSTGDIYLALDAGSGEIMVVRQVQMSDTDVESTVKIALRRERQVLEGLDHVNIIQCLGYEETGKVCNLFLEYVAGGSLHDWLRKYGRLNEDIVQSFSEHILSGLEYLHSAGIIHSNLNSSHVLVDASGCCKITNFMDCRRHTEMRTTSRSTILSGCIFWMAPEAVAAQAECSSQIEVWSFGCTVLEMWTGKRPWHGQDATTVRLWLSRTKAPPVDGIVLSPLADDFRQRCFAKSPAQRLTASELRQHPYLELPSAYLFSGLA